MAQESQYGKILVGEGVDEEDELIGDVSQIAHGTPYEEPATAVPVYYRRPAALPEMVPVTPPHGYGTAVGHAAPLLADFREPGEDCAQIGCLFSWIPIIGFITCCYHIDAPPLSRREYFAHRACCVATIIVVVNLIFWLSYEETDDCTSLRC